ncbi:MAG: hypothetical protein JXA20_09405 [Spirochaetes bacterium]|nr:hypothetical protein [Spirochaetota bacterium]
MSTAHDDIERFRELLRQARPEDFDGHTEFERMAPEERLMWLSQCAQFCAEINGVSR